MSAEDLEIQLPADATGNAQGSGLSSILQTGNGTHHERWIPSLVQISSPSKDEEDSDYFPEDVTNVSRVCGIDMALIKVPV